MYFYGSILVVIYAATWATFKSKKKEATLKQFLIFLEMEISSSKIKKFLIFWEMELSNPKIKILIFPDIELF